MTDYPLRNKKGSDKITPRCKQPERDIYTMSGHDIIFWFGLPLIVGWSINRLIRSVIKGRAKMKAFFSYSDESRKTSGGVQIEPADQENSMNPLSNRPQVPTRTPEDKLTD
jgi:hypothetical protein